MKATSRTGHPKSHDNAFRKLRSDDGYHYFSGLEKNLMFSQDELRTIYENLSSLKEDDKYRVEPRTQPGLQIKSTILQAIGHFSGNFGITSSSAIEAFPDVHELLEQVLTAFESGTIVVDCISLEAISAPNMKAISYFSEGCIHLIVGCELSDGSQQNSMNMFSHRYV